MHLIDRPIIKALAMKYKLAFFAALLLVCLSSCETLNINKDNRNALVIKPARHSNVDPGALTNEGTLYYSFGSLFFGGLADYEKSSAPNCEIFHGAYTVCPRWDVEEPLVSISAVWYNDVEYTKPGQAIERICITGLDESLGLGSTICIPMKQGKYKGGNDLIRNVRINAYQYGWDITFPGDKIPKADIDIIITSKAGDVINIYFSGDTTPRD